MKRKALLNFFLLSSLITIWYQLSIAQLSTVDTTHEVCAYVNQRSALLQSTGVINGARQFVSTTVTLKILLVEFLDVQHRTTPGAYTKSAFEKLLVSTGQYVKGVMQSPDGGNVYGSMNDYFQKMSSGNLTIAGYVVNTVGLGDIPNWIVVPHNKAYYDGFDYWNSPFIGDALSAASAAGLDVSTGSNVCLAIIYAGNTHFNLKGLNPLQSGSYYYTSERQGRPYNVENSTDKFARIGTHCHEFAHWLGICHTTGSRADLMEAGYRNGDNGDGGAPAPLNPGARWSKGWVTVTPISGQQEWDANYSLTAPQIFKIASTTNGDYFLFENRRFTQTMVIGTTIVPDYNNIAFFPPAWPHGTISQGIFVWRYVNGQMSDYSNNGLLYASGRYGATWPENDPSETDDGVPFPGVSNARVLSPWSDPRDPAGNLFVPNTKPSLNIGMEVVSVNDVAGTIKIDLYETSPEDASPTRPTGLALSANPNGQHMTLTWSSNPEPNIASYEVSRSIPPPGGDGLFHVIGSVDGGTTTYVDWTFHWLPYGYGATYKLRAKNDHDCYSDFSTEAYHKGLPKEGMPTVETPMSYLLTDAYPNPFNPSTVLRYGLPEAGLVTLKIYDLLGREVASLVEGNVEQGYHEAIWNASGVSSGVYLARFTVSDAVGKAKFVKVGKLVLMK